MSALPRVAAGQVWQHRNGILYQVLLLTNESTTQPDLYPVTVVYRNFTNFKNWSRPLADWHRSMTWVAEAPEGEWHSKTLGEIVEEALAANHAGDSA